MHFVIDDRTLDVEIVYVVNNDGNENHDDDDCSAIRHPPADDEAIADAGIDDDAPETMSVDDPGAGCGADGRCDEANAERRREEEEGANPPPGDGGESRRLVEYFVVVSSVPRWKKRGEAEMGSPKWGSPRRKRAEDDEGELERQASQSSQTAARMDARRAHLDRDRSGSADVADNAASSAVDATAEGDGRSAAAVESDGAPPPSPIRFPTGAAASPPEESAGPRGEDGTPGGSAPLRNRTGQNSRAITLDCVEELVLGESASGGGEPAPSDGRGAAASGTPQGGAAARTLKKNFLRSVGRQKEKIRANTARLNERIHENTARMNAKGLHNLERTVEGLNGLKLLTTPERASLAKEGGTRSAKGEGRGNRRRKKKDTNDSHDDDQSSVDSGGSSFSLDGDDTPRTETSTSTFRPSPNLTSARNVSAPAPPSPHSPYSPHSPLPPPPPPPPPLISVPPSPRGAPEGVRISPLPDRHGVAPRGASDNIRVGGRGDEGDAAADDDCMLESVVTAQYPPVDHPDRPLNPMINQFCHPRGADAIVPSREFKMPTVHHFVLTDERGGKLYGTCLTVHEEFAGRGGRDKRRKRYAPRVLCLLSTWPYLTAFRTYLVQLYRLATTTDLMEAPLERYIQNICSEVPAPPPGSFEVRLEILGTTVRFWAPPADQPVPYVSLPYGVLFECLDVGNVLFAWYTLACERKLLLVSSQLSLLAVCGEILCSMLFPMRWSHLYIPCLPRLLTPMLDAPMPYLCGIGRDIFPLAVADISDETVVVDLDRNVITMGGRTPALPVLPQRRKRKLESALERHAGDVFWRARGTTASEVERARLDGDVDALTRALGTADGVWDERIGAMDEAFHFAPAPDSMTLLHSDDAPGAAGQSRWDAVQEAFLRFYASVLKDYRGFLPSATGADGRQQSGWRGSGPVPARFPAEDFVASAPPDLRPFLEELVGTQQFDDFVTRRMYNAGDAPDVKFFDQSIDAKRNRSRLQLRKKETPFLHSAVAQRKLRRVDAIPPSRAGLRGQGGDRHAYPTWPEGFDQSLYGRPRPIPRIITAEFDRRAALNAMLKARHDLAGGAGLPGSTNPSPEATAFVLFFATFSNTIGKEWVSLEAEHVMMGENMLDQCLDSVSVDTPVSDRLWKPTVNPPWMAPKVNPPWMAAENDFHSLHSTFRPSKSDPPEVVVHDDGPTKGFFGPDCANFCRDIGKVIEPSTFIGRPWARHDALPIETPSMEYIRSPSEEERENDVEKARSIAKAQIDFGFNTLKMMRLRKLPTESITYKTLIEACGRCGIAHRAQQLIEMMTQDGLALDGEVYFAFIKAISNSGTEGTEAPLPHISTADTCSEFSANTAIQSTTSSNFFNSPHGENNRHKDSTNFMDGIQNAMSSTIETNRRAFKAAKVKRLKRLQKQILTKQKHLHVSRAIKTHLELGYCILVDLYPGINIDTNSDTCPKCSRVLSQDNIILGWKPCQVKDFSTACPSCKHRFVPKFSVSCSLESFEGSQGKGTQLYCDYLSPWVLLQEIRSLVATSIGGKAAKVLGVGSDDIEQIGIDGIIDPKFREGSGINATLWWNMIVTFTRFKIPYTFLLQGSYGDQQLIMPTLEDT